jgi:exonuclease SbcD
MRILHTSDWHLGRNLEQISRIDEQREFIDCLCKTVEELKIDLVLVAGDVYDTYNPSAAAEELFYDAIDRLNGKGKRAVVVIAGNHDNPERLCAASPLAYKNGIILLGYPGSDAGIYKTGGGSIKIADSGPGWLELCVPGCEHHAVIITLPYPSESRLEEILSQQADEGILQKAYSDKIGSIFSSLSQKFRDDTVNLAVGHLFLRGGKESESERTLQVGGALTVDPGILPSNAHFVALGHLHRPQEIRNAPCPVFYSGSPLAYSFSEAEHSKAVYIIDAVPGEKADVRPLYLDCGKPLRRWVAEEGVGQAIRWCEEGRDLNAWIDLEIVTDRVLTVEEQKALRSLHPGIINIRPRLKSEAVEVASPQSREGKKIDELFKDFYKFRMQAEISDELMGAFIEILNEEDEEVMADETEAS